MEIRKQAAKVRRRGLRRSLASGAPEGIADIIKAVEVMANAFAHDC